MDVQETREHRELVRMWSEAISEAVVGRFIQTSGSGRVTGKDEEKEREKEEVGHDGD